MQRSFYFKLVLKNFVDISHFLTGPFLERVFDDVPYSLPCYFKRI